MKKLISTLSALIVAIVLSCISLKGNESHDWRCEIICPTCGSLEINHTHPNNNLSVFYAHCRTCGQNWYQNGEVIIFLAPTEGE